MVQASGMPKIGKNIAAIRKSMNLSLEELSKRSGVSTGMLSQIEQEKVNPTVAVVWKIAYGLGVPLYELVAQESDKPMFEVTRRNEAVILERDEGRCIFRILSPLMLAEKLELYTLSMKKNGVLESSPHSHGTEEFVTVISGSVEVEVDKHQARLGEGDTIHYHSDVPHTIKNTCDGDSFLYMVVKYQM